MNKLPTRIDKRSGGFTLVELLVALMLAAIISVVISFISTNARSSYTTTVAKVEVYNQFRLAFKDLQTDLAQWIPTQELEFYIDGRGGRPQDFHWQPGEGVPDRTDDQGTGVVDGGVKGDYDEFAFIEEGHYKTANVDKESDDLGNNVHDAYRLYFRTMTYVDGALREANVEYMLVDASQPPGPDGLPPSPKVVTTNGKLRDLTLLKVVRYYIIDAETITQLVDYPIKRRIRELATNITDFRVEYMVHNAFNSKARSVFRTPAADYAKFAERATRPVKVDDPGGASYRKVFGYGSMKLEQKYPLAVAFSARWGDDQLRQRRGHQPVRFGFESDPNIHFAELTPGDRIFVFTDQSSGAGRKAGSGGGGGGPNVAQDLKMKPGDYTVKANLEGLLEFFEDVDSSKWGDKDQRPIYYKAAFIPSALRVTLRMVDDKGESPKTMQQVIWLRRKAR